MATEVTIVLRFEDVKDIPSRVDIEDEFECVVLEWEEEEV